MKKQLTLLICAITCGLPVLAQGLYFKAGGGYALPVATQTIGEKYVTKNFYDGNTTQYSSTMEAVTASFGAGATFSGAAGFMFNEFLGAELGVQYTLGKKFETKQTYDYEDQSQSYWTSDVLKTNHFSRAIFVNPAFIVTPGAGRNVPYGRFGLMIGSPTVKGEESSVNKVSYYPDVQDVETRKWEYSKNVAIGLQAAVGMNWMVSDKIDIFTEVNFVSMTYYPGEYNLTEDMDNDYDNLPNRSAYDKKTIFKDKVDVSSEPDTSKPREETREGMAFSSLSVQVGIVFLLNGHGEN